jgi:hypothetical protein
MRRKLLGTVKPVCNKNNKTLIVSVSAEPDERTVTTGLVEGCSRMRKENSAPKLRSRQVIEQRLLLYLTLVSFFLVFILTFRANFINQCHRVGVNQLLGVRQQACR